MLSSLIKNRPLCIALTVGSLIYLAFSLYSISLMQCPVNELFHVRCPGFGLTHAVMALMHGDFMTSGTGGILCYYDLYDEKVALRTDTPL